MKTLRLLLPAILLLFPLGILMATPAQDVIPLSSPVYADMDDLYLLAGIGTPSDSRPWTVNEARALLDVADGFPLSETARHCYEVIDEVLSESLRWSASDGFSAHAALDISGEAYVHANDDDSGGFTSYEDWTYGFVDRKPLARLRLEMAIDPFFYTYCDLQYGYGIATYSDVLHRLSEDHERVGALIPDSSDNDVTYVDGDSHLNQYTSIFATNFITASRDFDFQWPKRALVSVGGTRWNLTIGRGKLDWGNSHIGNFVIDNHVDFHDYLRFTAFSRHFKYEYLNLFFDTSYLDDGDSNLFRMLLAHRLEFRPFDKLSVAVSENVMYQDTMFDFRFINPAFIYHNLNQRSKFNAIAHLELDYVPTPGLLLYGQFVLDQATAPNEDPDKESSAWGLSVGISHARAIGDGVHTMTLEGAVTLPCLYRRDGIDFLMARRYAGLNGDDGPSHWYTEKFDYIGFPYGGDAVVVKWDNEYRVAGSHALEGSFTMVLHGPMDMYRDVLLDHSTVTYGKQLFKGGIVDGSLTATVSGKLDLVPVWGMSAFELHAVLSTICRTSYRSDTGKFDNWTGDVQLSAGATITY